MNKYIARVLEATRAKNANEPEFLERMNARVLSLLDSDIVNS